MTTAVAHPRNLGLLAYAMDFDYMRHSRQTARRPDRARMASESLILTG
jgi:hypothetical protein